jgi:hypothetical protein
MLNPNFMGTECGSRLFDRSAWRFDCLFFGGFVPRPRAYRRLILLSAARIDAYIPVRRMELLARSEA